MSDSFEVIQAVDDASGEICRLQAENARLRVEVIEAKQATDRAERLCSVLSASCRRAEERLRKVRPLVFELGEVVGDE